MNQRTRATRPSESASRSALVRAAVSSPVSLRAMRAQDIAALQSIAGNRATRAAVGPQRSMNVGAAGDSYEVEADAVAREVVNMTSGAQPAQREAAEEEELQMQRVQRDAGLEEEELQMKRVQREAGLEEEELQMKRIQREAGPEEEELMMKRVQRDAGPEEEELMMKRVQRDAAPEVGMDGGAASAETSAAIETARGGGSALPDGVRREMEGAFGADFSGVRVHQGGEAADLNQRLSARAFTTGSDIFIGQGGLNPASRGGKELLAHELTHVVQQGGAARKARRRS